MILFANSWCMYDVSASFFMYFRYWLSTTARNRASLFNFPQHKVALALVMPVNRYRKIDGYVAQFTSLFNVQILLHFSFAFSN